MTINPCPNYESSVSKQDVETEIEEKKGKEKKERKVRSMVETPSQ